MPSPGGYPTNLEWFGGNASGNTTARNYLWLDNGSGHAGTVVYSDSSTYTLTTTQQFWNNAGALTYRNNATGYTDGYIPPGTVLWVGVWVSSANYIFKCAPITSSGYVVIGTGGDGNFNWHDYARDNSSNPLGYLAAVITYTPATPHITSVSDNNIYPGEVITLTGYAFNGATSVGFNGTNASTYTINSNTQITVTVPTGITAGNITVSNANGTGTGPAYTVVGGYVFRSGVWTPSQGTFVYRSGTWTPASGVFVFRGGVWQPSQ